jgi:hypothetical protein
MNRLAVSMLVMATLLIPNLPAMAARKDAAQNSQVQVQAETQLACSGNKAKQSREQQSGETRQT